jgi:hypothetical protein
MYVLNFIKINQHSGVFGGIEETSPSPPFVFYFIFQLCVEVTPCCICFLFYIAVLNSKSDVELVIVFNSVNGNQLLSI